MSPHQLNYDFIKGLEPEGEVGCIIQCSLEYPVALHDYHSDYPLVISECILLRNHGHASSNSLYYKKILIDIRQ